MKVSHRFKRRLIVGPYGNGHAFLAFRNEDFPRRQAGLLQRNLGEVDFTAVRVFRHFTDGRRKPAGAVVRDAGDEAGISGLQHHVKHFLLRDGITDLDGTGRGFFSQFK